MEKEKKYKENLRKIMSKIHELDDILFDYPSRKSFTMIEIESCAITIRKIIEMISFGILIVNYDVYISNGGKINEWNIKRILKRIKEAKKKNYFINILPSEDGNIKRFYGAKELGYNEFIEIYNRVSGLIHERNPFLPEITKLEAEKLSKEIIKIRDEIVTLLNRHEICGIKIKMADITNRYRGLFGPTWM